MLRFVSALLCLVTALSAFAATSTAPNASQAIDDTQPVTIPDARQFDFTSKINGQTYRIMVYTPPKVDPGTPQPVTYVLDGNYYFGTACEAMGVNQLVGIIVGIGYPTDDHDEVVTRRGFDLTLPETKPDKKHGGGDAFLRVIEEEIKPMIVARYKIDPTRQALFGHSLGGLMVLRQMFRNPRAYSTYLAASPSIWWADRAVLADEDSFAKKCRAGEVHLRLLLTSASDEQYHGTDKILLEKAGHARMVDNASDLASRLSTIAPKDFAVTRYIFADETHRSGSQAALDRALCFTLHDSK